MAYKDKEKAKQYAKEYRQSPKGKEYNLKYMKKYRSLPDKREKNIKYQKEYGQTPKSRRAQSNRQLKRLYGIDLVEYNKLFELQNGRCAICFDLPSNKRFDTDHNHVSGKIRGLLCHRCNCVLGYGGDSILLFQEVMRYLKNNKNKLYKYSEKASPKIGDWHLKQKYGMTVSDYNELLERQHGKCAICFEPPTYRRLDVDHNHLTKTVRGLLCNKCNMTLGYGNDSILLFQEAIRYLESH